MPLRLWQSIILGLEGKLLLSYPPLIITLHIHMYIPCPLCPLSFFIALRCDKLLFMSSEHFEGLNTIALDIKESRQALWNKTKLAWMHVYQQYLNEYDWFLKADDDTFVVMHNLRNFLADFSPDGSWFFGRPFVMWRNKPNRITYCSGGSGYIFSRETLRKLGSNADKVLRAAGGVEDAEIGKALGTLHIYPSDTRDEEGSDRFLPLHITELRNMYQAKGGHWYYKINFFPYKDGMDCCSKHWIATHYIKPRNMYKLQKAVELGIEGCGTRPVQPKYHLPEKYTSKFPV
eukprot:m.140162 g.140162  ORF g.140162 m.140162 type:complete len:289 (+) comp24097_c0_seq8:522-1388(+)